MSQEETNRNRERLQAFLRGRQARRGTGESQPVGRLGWASNRRFLPQLRRLLDNPKGREIIMNFMASQDSGQEGDTGFASSGGLQDLGLDAMGSFEDLSTSSSAEEIKKYRDKLEARTSWLESALEQTLRELEKVSEFLDKKLAAEKKQARKAKKKPVKSKATPKKSTPKPAAQKQKAKAKQKQGKKEGKKTSKK